MHFNYQSTYIFIYQAYTIQSFHLTLHSFVIYFYLPTHVYAHVIRARFRYLFLFTHRPVARQCLAMT